MSKKDEKIKQIIEKLPPDAKAFLQCNYTFQKEWTPEWNEWAKEAIQYCNIARDNGIISKIEHETLSNTVFSKLGCIGPNVSHANFDAFAWLFYEEDKNELDK